MKKVELTLYVLGLILLPVAGLQLNHGLNTYHNLERQASQQMKM